MEIEKSTLLWVLVGLLGRLVRPDLVLEPGRDVVHADVGEDDLPADPVAGGPGRVACEVEERDAHLDRPGRLVIGDAKGVDEVVPPEAARGEGGDVVGVEHPAEGDEADEEALEGAFVIVDGASGQVYVDPDEALIKSFKERK